MAEIPPKVLIFLHSFMPGGVESDTLRLAHALQDLGVTVDVVMGRIDGPQRTKAEGLRLTVLQQPGMPSTAAFETLWMAARLPAVVRRLRPDVVLCAGNTYSIVAAVLRLALGAACPPIVLRVSNDLRRLDLPWPARALYHLWLRVQTPVFAAVVVMAPPVREEVLALMPVPPDRVHVILNGSIDAGSARRLAAARQEARPRPGRRRFLAIGRLVRQKNFTLLLEAFARMAGPGDRLVIAGEGPERRRLERQAAWLGIADRVAMPGHATDLAPLVADSDALVLSSDYEGLGVVLIEALAAGLPVIATDCCSAYPWLLDGLGTRVPPRRADRLAAAMAALVPGRHDPLPGRAMAERFTIEAAAPQWRDLLATVAGRRIPAVQHAAT